MNVENTADAPVARDSESVDEPINGVLPDLSKEGIKGNLEPLNEEISTLTQLLNQLIKKNSPRNSPTAGPRNQQTQPRHYSPSNEIGIFLPDSNEITVLEILLNL